MPLTTLAEKALLGLELGDASPTIPATHYCGLLVAATWTATTAVTSGQYVIPTTFASIGGGADQAIGKIFKCTTSGTTGSSQPTWPTTAGGTVTDGSAVWTEVSALFAAGTFTSAEPSGGAYARVAITNNTTNWPAPSAGDPAQVQNGTAVTFPTITASWGQAVGFGLWDASSAGNARAWGCLSAAAAGTSVVGVTPSFAINAITATLL